MHWTSSYLNSKTALALSNTTPAPTNVRYRGKSRPEANSQLCRLMTQTGIWLYKNWLYTALVLTVLRFFEAARAVTRITGRSTARCLLSACSTVGERSLCCSGLCLGNRPSDKGVQRVLARGQLVAQSRHSKRSTRDVGFGGQSGHDAESTGQCRLMTHSGHRRLLTFCKSVSRSSAPRQSG